MVAQKMTLIPRRQAMRLLTGVAASSLFPLRSFATPDKVASRISEITNGKKVSDIDIYLDMPEIAENGNTVPISVDAPGAVAITILAAGNPLPGVATFNFGDGAGSQSATTRIRLAGTQDVIAVAKMADGSFAAVSQTVKVTIGGCGG